MSNPLINAFPDGSKLTGDALRYLAESFALVLDNAATVPTTDFSDTPYKSIILDDSIFNYDANDTTTGHDGLTVLKSLDNRVYKLSDRVFLKAKAIDKDLVAQPSSPSLGDTYILTAAPTGEEWASKAKNIATYTARGWTFKAPQVGDIVFVSDEGQYNHYNSAGNWVAGLGDLGLSDNSITTAKLFRKFGPVVESVLSTPPPSIPSSGVQYIVGNSATGAWSGQSAKIAESTGSGWVFYDGYEGAVVFDKEADYSKAFRAGEWVQESLPSAILDHKSVIGDSSLTLSTTETRYVDGMTFTCAIDPLLHEIHLVADTTVTQSTDPVGLFLDNQTVPIDGGLFVNSSSQRFVYTPPDSASHTYRFGGRTGTSGTQIYTVGNVLFEIRVKNRGIIT